MAKRPNQPPEELPDAGTDDAPGATAFVRVEDAGGPPPRRAPPAAPASGAPKKGLQVQLPDDEPPPPKPKPKPAPAAAQSKGRRGAWWDEEKPKGGDEDEAPAAPEPSPDDAPGATAFLKTEAPPPPPRRKAPAPRAEPEEAPPAAEGRTQFFRPDEVMLQAEVRQRPPPQQAEPAMPWRQLALALGIAFVIVVLGLLVVFRTELFGGPSPHPSRPAAKASGQGGE